MKKIEFAVSKEILVETLFSFTRVIFFFFFLIEFI